MKMKKFIPYTVITAVIFTLAGCGSSSTSGNATSSTSKVTNITVWDSYSKDAGKQFNQLVDEFNQSHPNIHVTAQYITVGDNMLPKIMTALSGNQEPDLVAGGYPTWGPGLLGSGKVVNLNDNLKNSKTLHPNDFYPGMLDVSTYKGQVLSIPNDGGDFGLFYNKDIFKQASLDPNSPPKTWDDVIKDSQIIKQKTGKNGYYVPIGNAEWTVWMFEGMLWANGGTFIDTTGDKAKVEFNSPAGIKALQAWVDLIHKYNVSPNTGYPSTVSQAEIIQKNDNAMVADGPWDIQPLQTANFPLGTTMFPKGDQTYATGLGSDTFYIFKTGDAQQKAAWTFIEWFMQPSNLANWDIKAGYLPTLKSVVNTDTYKKYLEQNPNFKPLVDNLQYAKGRPTLKSYNAISAELGNQLENALYGKVSAKDALDAAATQAQQILQQNGE